MPSTISAGTTAGTAIAVAGDTTGNLAFQTNGTTTAMTIDTSQNVGIGTSSITPRDAGARVLEIYGGTDGRSSIKMTNSTSGVGATDGMFIGYDDNLDFNLLNTEAGNLKFGTSNTEQARITAAGLFQFNSGYGSVATAFGCRAWVNFNGTDTVAIRASGNVSSITDNGTGTYDINFTTAMPNANYSAVGSSVNSSSSLVGITAGGNYQTTFLAIRTTNDAGSLQDPNQCSYAIFR